MDKIQRFLVKQGRSDLAQKYYEKFAALKGRKLEKSAQGMTKKEFDAIVTEIDQDKMKDYYFLGNHLTHRTVREYLDAKANPNYDEEKDPEGYLTHGIGEFEGLRRDIIEFMDEHDGLREYLKRRFNLTDDWDIAEKFIDEDIV